MGRRDGWSEVGGKKHVPLFRKSHLELHLARVGFVNCNQTTKTNHQDCFPNPVLMELPTAMPQNHVQVAV